MYPSEKEITTQRISSHDAKRALSTLSLAFSSDPICRWVWPDAQTYQTSFPRFAEAFGGRAFGAESGYEVADFRGAALWLPPRTEPDEATLVEIVETTVREEQKPALYALLQAMGENHFPEPHWYLPLVGVDPMYQGRGFGRIVMSPVLAHCDETKLPAYLESSNPQNIPFYERLGFRIVGRIQVADSPVLVPMLRDPR